MLYVFVSTLTLLHELSPRPQAPCMQQHSLAGGWSQSRYPYLLKLEPRAKERVLHDGISSCVLSPEPGNSFTNTDGPSWVVFVAGGN